VEDDKNTFPVYIDRSKLVGDFKDVIKEKNPNAFANVDAKDLQLWQVNILRNDVQKTNFREVGEELDELDEVGDYWKVEPPKRHIHVIIARPPGKYYGIVVG